MFLIFPAYPSPKRKFLQQSSVRCKEHFLLVPNCSHFRCSRAETCAVENIPLNDSSALGSQVKDTCSIQCGLLTPYSIGSNRFHSSRRPHLPS